MSIIITRIEPQKRKKNRYSIFAGDQFIAGISDQTLLEFNLYRGVKLTQEELNKIKDKEDYLLVREQALRFLSRRAHSIREMRIKLLNKGYGKVRINQIIEELLKKKYLDDRNFARIFIQDEIRLKRTGPLRMRQKLRVKGIEDDITAELLRSLYPDSLQSDNATELAQKKMKNLKSHSAAYIQAQLAQYLKNKGYTWQIAGPIIQHLTGEISDEKNETE